MSDPLDLRLLRLETAGFGRLDGFEFTPNSEPGALIVAPNEAGKSTLAAAIFHALFGFYEKSAEDERRPWEGGPFAVTTEWACGPTTTCTIERDFETQRVAVTWRETGVLDRRWEGEPNPRGRSSDRAAYDAELRRLLGFVSPDIFRQTAFIGPGDTSKRPLAAELLRLLSGSERADFRTALHEFEARYYDLTQKDLLGSGRAVKRKFRRIETLIEERAERVRNRETARAVADGRREAEERLATVRERLTEIDGELEERAHAQGAIARMASLRREIEDVENRLQAVEADLQRFVKWERTVRERSGALESHVRYLHMPDDFVERLGRLREINDQLAQAAEEVDAVEIALSRVPGFQSVFLIAGAGGLLVLLAVFLVALGTGRDIGIGLAAAAGLTLAYAAWLGHRRRRARQGLMVRWTSTQGEIVRLGGEQRDAGHGLSFDVDSVDLDVEVERYGRAQRLKAELDGMQQARIALGDRQSLENQRKRLKEEQLDVLRLERRNLLERHTYLEWGPDYERQFARELETLETERQRMRSDELDQRRALADLPGATDDPHRLTEMIGRIDAELDRLKLDRDACRLAHVTLTDCKNEFVRVMTHRLERSVGEVFSDLTEGRYESVAIDPVELTLRVDGVEKRGVPAESLSRGTRDQLYFALRVALLEEFAANRALPIVLDDPFLHFDRQRLAQVERTLQTLGRRHQILLFTHDTRLAGWTFPKQYLPELGSKVSTTSAD